MIEYCVSRDDIRFEIPEYGTFCVARNSDYGYEFSVYYEETGAHFFCGFSVDEWVDRCYDGDEDPDDVFAEKITDIVDRCIAFADSNTFSVVSTTNRQHTVTKFTVASDYSNINAAHGYYDFSDVYADGETWGSGSASRPHPMISTQPW